MDTLKQMMTILAASSKDQADTRAVNQMALIQSMVDKAVPAEKSDAKEATKAQSAISHPMSYITGDCPLQKKDRDAGM
jgi:soluble cytochrome b562